MNKSTEENRLANRGNSAMQFLNQMNLIVFQKIEVVTKLDIFFPILIIGYSYRGVGEFSVHW